MKSLSVKKTNLSKAVLCSVQKASATWERFLSDPEVYRSFWVRNSDSRCLWVTETLFWDFGDLILQLMRSAANVATEVTLVTDSISGSVVPLGMFYWVLANWERCIGDRCSVGLLDTLWGQISETDLQTEKNVAEFAWYLASWNQSGTFDLVDGMNLGISCCGSFVVSDPCIMRLPENCLTPPLIRNHMDSAQMLITFRRSAIMRVCILGHWRVTPCIRSSLN